MNLRFIKVLLSAKKFFAEPMISSMFLTALWSDQSFFWVFCRAGYSSSELSRIGEKEEIVDGAGRLDEEVGVSKACDESRSVCEWVSEWTGRVRVVV